ncbi:unnamed protein product [Rodentolepis nana]|uniref:ORF3 n=1 Tax=Rodentolepis nana TaxID=102285 RepID=A0A0R3TAQ5_RODNA|nr:unnamed protein product [Rodentolepis nana]
MRVLAVLCGLQGPAWRLRPNFQSGRMENETIFGDIPMDSSEEPVDDSSRYYPPPDFDHPGLLFLLTNENGPEGRSTLDSRRAYQCMKFLVELASENTAVVEGLSRFPHRWGPAVEWLESLLEESDKTSSPVSSPFGRSTPLTRHLDLIDSIPPPPPTVNGRLRSGTYSGPPSKSRMLS